MARNSRASFFIRGKNRLRRKMRAWPDEIRREVSDEIDRIGIEAEQEMRFNWVSLRPGRLTSEGFIDLAENIKRKRTGPGRGEAKFVEKVRVGFSKKFGVRHWLRRQGFVARWMERGASQFQRFPRGGLEFIAKTRREIYPRAIRDIDRAVHSAIVRVVRRYGMGGPLGD